MCESSTNTLQQDCKAKFLALQIKVIYGKYFAVVIGVCLLICSGELPEGSVRGLTDAEGRASLAYPGPDLAHPGGADAHDGRRDGTTRRETGRGAGTSFNPFTLRDTVESIVCYSHTFKNNLGIKQKLAKYLKEGCCLASDQHFSFKCFPKNAFSR